MQHAGGMLLPPVQKLVATSIFFRLGRKKMQIESTIPHQKNTKPMAWCFSAIFALRRVILAAPVIFASQVILGFAQVYGEYNITFAVGENITVSIDTISLRRSRNIAKTFTVY